MENFDFGKAIALLKQGEVVARESWQGKKAIIKQVPAKISKEIIPKMQSLPDAAKQMILENGNTNFIRYQAQTLEYYLETGRADSWHPTQDDIYAEDWIQL